MVRWRDFCNFFHFVGMQDLRSLADISAFIDLLYPASSTPSAFKTPRSIKVDTLLAHPLYDTCVVLRCDTLANGGAGEAVAPPRGLRDLLRLYYIAQRLAKLDERLFNILRNVITHKDSRRITLEHIVCMLEVRDVSVWSLCWGRLVLLQPH